jgi:uncharacterized cofD-like protein
MKKIVCLGGGNAMPKAVLEGLKHYPVKISVICAMLDSGGSAGRLRRDYKIVSPGDIRRALIALADTSPVMSDLFNYRFEVGELKGHNFANLLITALELSSNSYEKTMDEVKRMLKIRHEVLPATLDRSNLCAVLENGKTIRGETNIDIPKHDPKLRIKRVFLQPKAQAYEKAVSAALEADAIIIGPGDLYSSLAQILLVDGMSEAIAKSKAKKIYLSNVMTKRGETDGYDVETFTNEIEKYLGGEVDYVLYNSRQPAPSRVARHKAADRTAAEVVSLSESSRSATSGKFVGLDLLSDSGSVVHDPEKVAAAIIRLTNSKKGRTKKRKAKIATSG